jgi:hypothetical protein
MSSSSSAMSTRVLTDCLLRRAFSKFISFRLFFFVLGMLCGGGLPHTNSLCGCRSLGYFVISGTAAGELDTVEFCKAMELHLTVVCISWLGLFSQSAVDAHAACLVGASSKFKNCSRWNSSFVLELGIRTSKACSKVGDIFCLLA